MKWSIAAGGYMWLLVAFQPSTVGGVKTEGFPNRRLPLHVFFSCAYFKRL